MSSKIEYRIYYAWFYDVEALSPDNIKLMKKKIN